MLLGNGTRLGVSRTLPLFPSAQEQADDDDSSTPASLLPTPILTPDSLLVPAADSRLLATAPRSAAAELSRCGNLRVGDQGRMLDCAKPASVVDDFATVLACGRLCRRVIEWLAEVLPEQLGGRPDRETRLRATDDRRPAAACLSTIDDPLAGNPRPEVLSRAMRITLALGKLGVIPGTIDGLLADAIEAAQSGSPRSGSSCYCRRIGGTVRRCLGRHCLGSR